MTKTTISYSLRTDNAAHIEKIKSRFDKSGISYKATDNSLEVSLENPNERQLKALMPSNGGMSRRSPFSRSPFIGSPFGGFCSYHSSPFDMIGFRDPFYYWRPHFDFLLHDLIMDTETESQTSEGDQTSTDKKAGYDKSELESLLKRLDNGETLDADVIRNLIHGQLNR